MYYVITIVLDEESLLVRRDERSPWNRNRRTLMDSVTFRRIARNIAKTVSFDKVSDGHRRNSQTTIDDGDHTKTADILMSQENALVSVNSEQCPLRNSAYP